LRLVEAGAAATSLELGSGTTVALPFSVRLLDFRMERYAPTLTLARRDPATGTWAVQAGRRSLIPGQTERLGDYAVRVEEYLVRARVDGDGTVLACDSSGAGPAARVAVTDSAGQPVAEGWLHAASWFGSDLFQRLAEGTVLLLDPGKPKQFASTLELGLDGRAETVAVAVNQPARRHGWTLMQSGYDAEAGPASRLSVIDVGRDRSLPFIHVGIGLVLVGVILMALAPNRKRPEAA
jgi:hypothetical protein